MSHHPQYLIAKHIPELDRNEPRNFGLVLWTPWGVRTRFLGETTDGIDGRKLPSWVQNTEVLKEWVYAWRRMVEQGRALTVAGSKVPTTTPDFLGAMADLSHGNYLLADRGVVFEDLDQEDVPALLNYLFQLLVEQNGDAETLKSGFDIEKECNRLIKQVGRSRHPNLIRRQPVICNIGGVLDTFNFDYYVRNGQTKPKKLYQRIVVGQRGFDSVIHSTAWQFEKVVADGLIAREDGAALVMPTEEQKSDEEFRRAMSVLGTQTRVIDLSVHPDIFQEELLQVLPKPADESLVS